MDPKIPSNLKRYIRKVRDGKKEKKLTQKQKQVNKQSQIVIINQEPSKRKSQPRRRKISANNDYPNIAYIPTSVPNMSVAMNQPQNISQPIPQSISQFEQVPIYRNPFRNEAMRGVFNPPPQFASYQVEQNLPNISIASPPPLEPKIVLEQNNIDFLSRPINPIPISYASSVFQGFTENQSVNQLNEQVTKEVNAYDDFGGLDAQSEAEQRASRLESEFYNYLRSAGESMSESDEEQSIALGGGGGGVEGSPTKGRRPNKLNDEELRQLFTYIKYEKMKKRERNQLPQSEQNLYEEGKKLNKKKRNTKEYKKYREQIEDIIRKK